MDKDTSRLGRTRDARSTGVCLEQAGIPNLTARPRRTASGSKQQPSHPSQPDPLSRHPPQSRAFALGSFRIVAQELGRSIGLRQLKPNGGIRGLPRAVHAARLGCSSMAASCPPRQPPPFLAQRILRQIEEAVGVMELECGSARQMGHQECRPAHRAGADRDQCLAEGLFRCAFLRSEPVPGQVPDRRGHRHFSSHKRCIRGASTPSQYGVGPAHDPTQHSPPFVDGITHRQSGDWSMIGDHRRGRPSFLIGVHCQVGVASIRARINCVVVVVDNSARPHAGMG